MIKMLNAEFLRNEITTKKNKLDGLVKEVVDAIDNAIEKKDFFIDISNEEISIMIPKTKYCILEDTNVLNAFDNFMVNERGISYMYRYIIKNNNDEEIGKIMFKEYNASDKEDIETGEITF